MIIDTMELNPGEIDILLKDISDYLKRRKEDTTLSAEDRKMVESLIERSKKQLQKIAVIKKKEEDECYDVIDIKSDFPANKGQQQSPKTEDERYVDMTKKSPVESPPPLPLKKVELKPRKTPPETTKCPFSDLPARQVSHEIKHGTLFIRRKVFSIIDRSSKVFGAVHENWLLMYWSSKDAKPFCALDLKHYEAKEDESDPTLTELDITRDGGLRKSNVKMASSFKVFQSTSPEKKCYNFVATTHKDMLQWVVNINRSHDKAVRAGKDIEEQVYDICEEPPSDVEEENIYNEIDLKPASKPPAPLPKNQDRIAESEILPAMKPSSTSESTEEIYQVLADTTDKKSLTSINSFEFSEEDEDDQTYYELATVREEVKELELKVQQAEKFNYDIPPPLHPFVMNNPFATDDKENYENTALLIPSRLPEVTETSIEAGKEKLDIKLEVPEVPRKNGNELGAEFSEKVLVRSPDDKPNKILQNKNRFSSRSDQKYSSSNRDSLGGTNKSNLLHKKDSSKELSTNNNSESVGKKETSEKSLPSKPNPTSSIVKIIRQRFSTIESQSPSLETFSRNSKLETFQASPTKDDVLSDFVFLNSDIDESLRINSLESKKAEQKSNKKKANDDKPMVLLKADLGEEESSKKFKKSPVVNKPKKVARKLQL